ncbi:serine/threonine-protein kinase STY46-like [Humulus lupulus]|uniref:serine/threonine-protein kinase STY46-like n=1 Tax=Humulus lupulus TaxID=3486 RepID=UPI002B4098A3|nr:serine/threonine-protein kinase STY46-like [Humulus lupulus]
MGSNVSTNQREKFPIYKLEQQVLDLERQVLKHKELQITLKRRMERTQDYLRHCLQIAQENGFLDLICQNKDPPPPRTPCSQHHSELVALVDTANRNGWYIAPNEIEFHEKIGQGSTADIYRGTWRGCHVAVKCINPHFFTSNDKAVTFFAQELETLARQRHRFVLQLMGACLDPPNHAWAVTELLGMTLEEWLHGPGGRPKRMMTIRADGPVPPLGLRLTRALEIAQAMQYLHEQRPKVVHRDLKPSNIFLDDALHVRVADFGHAMFLYDQEMALSGDTGTYVYMAPEIIKCEPYNEKCDVYSFGVIMNELMTGEYPYIQIDYGPPKIAMEVVESDLRPRLPEDENGALREVIELICLSWNGDPSKRPSFATITCLLKKIIIQNTIMESTILD